MFKPNRLLRLKSCIARLARDRKGASVVLSALMLPVLIGFVGLAIDVGVWQVSKRALQGAVDQAVYSAAISGYKGETVDQAKIQAKAVMASMGFTDGAGGVTVTVTNPATSGNYVGNARSWQVTASKTQDLYFAGLFLSSAPTVSVTATALQGYTTTSTGGTTTNPGNGCILTLDTSASYATEVTNNGAVSNSNCAIYTNSNSSTALGCYNNCNIAADTFTVGNYYKSGTMSGTNKTGQTAIADPYASLTTPDATEMGTTCATTAVVKAGTAATKTITPGRYCKGINFTGAGKTLIMTAGTYYVETIFMVGNGATLSATTGVTIVIVGNYCLGDTNNTCQHPDEGIGNSSTLNITAPTTGKYAGVAMYFSSNTYKMHNWANNSTMNVQGVFYAPKQKLSFNNNSYFNNAKCTKIIALRVTINNNGNMSNDCNNTGVKTIGDWTSTSSVASTTVNSSMVE